MLTIILLCKQNLRKNQTVADPTFPVSYGHQSSVNGETIITESHVQSRMLPWTGHYSVENTNQEKWYESYLWTVWNKQLIMIQTCFLFC